MRKSEYVIWALAVFFYYVGYDVYDAYNYDIFSELIALFCILIGSLLALLGVLVRD